MAEISINLTNCDLEPIHIPGRIQSHGFLVAVDSANIIRIVSANTGEFIAAGVADLLGQTIQRLEALLITDPGLLLGLTAADNPQKINIAGAVYNCITADAGNYRLFEFERAATIAVQDTQRMLHRSLPAILGGKNLTTLLAYAATEVKKIIGFDRVMIYRFAADGHGEVIMEAKNEDLESWLGLHYPASDIPKQARELYKINLTRLIADVFNENSALLAAAEGPSLLDLTHSNLRAVSPVHIQYLKNMGVASSFSISLLYRGELWGLIACHNYSPRFIDFESREMARLVGQIVSSALEFRQDEENVQAKESFDQKITDLSHSLHSTLSIEEALLRQPISMLEVVNATGVALLYDKKIRVLGETPTESELMALADWLHEKKDNSLFYSNALPSSLPAAGLFQKFGAGILAITLSKELKEYVIWFKPEMVQQVKWAGNPDKPAAILADGLQHISPRHSFETWVKEVSGVSQEWTNEEIKSARRFREELLDAINTRASALRLINERLQDAYEELDTFSYTISHDLKTPITAIKGYAQLLAADPVIPPDAVSLLQRIGSRADKMAMMIKEVLEYSRISRTQLQFHNINIADMIKEITEDLQQVYQSSKLQVTIGKTPVVWGDPMMIWQVFSNLISNAVKYSQFALPPKIRIDGQLTDTEIIYTVKDNGVGIPENDLDKVFTLFSRMDNVHSIEGTGVGLAIVKKIVEKHNGNIWAVSELDKGTTFYVSFKKH